jgi:hypothetical protein
LTASCKAGTYGTIPHLANHSIYKIVKFRLSRLAYYREWINSVTLYTQPLRWKTSKSAESITNPRRRN